MPWPPRDIPQQQLVQARLRVAPSRTQGHKEGKHFYRRSNVMIWHAAFIQTSISVACKIGARLLARLRNHVADSQDLRIAPNATASTATRAGDALVLCAPLCDKGLLR